jgi:hypothetical protein
MPTDIRITLAGRLGQAVEDAARAEGKSVNELAAEVLRQDIARRAMSRLNRQAALRRCGMTEEEIERVVDRPIAETRG